MLSEQVDKRWLVVIGLGLALVPIHSEFLTNLVTFRGQVLLHIPTLGFVLVVVGAALFVTRHWQLVKGSGLGDRKIWIPLIVIVVAMGISGLANGITIRSQFAPLFMGVALFVVYIVSRVLGEGIFRYLMPFVIVGSASVIISGILLPGQYTGGFITNYCASAGFLIFGALVYRGRWRLLLLAIAGAGLFFIGALEAVFIVGVLGIVLLIRRDVSLYLALAFGSLMIMIGVWSALGYFSPLYEGNLNLAVLRDVVTGKVPLDTDAAAGLTSGRWNAIVEAVRNFSFIGYGYSLSTVGGGIVHNMPLIIMYQIGPFAALAWLFVSVYCLIKTGWKYAWVAILAMGVWDHYIWTQMAPWWWALVGVSTASGLRSDYIFKEGK